jgi:hypothetical protein
MRNIVAMLPVLGLYLVLGAATVRGDSVTLVGPTSVTIPEDGTVRFLTYTLTNNSGGTITGIDDVLGIFRITVGDVTDLAAHDLLDAQSGTGNATCNRSGSLLNTASCTLLFQIQPDDGAGETDADFGQAFFEPTVNFNFASGQPGSVFVDVTVTTTDPGFAAVPEPSSLLLLGTGFLGLVGAGLRKKWLA